MENIELSRSEVRELNRNYIGRGHECFTFKYDDNGSIFALQLLNTAKSETHINKLKKAIRLNQKVLDDRFIIPKKTVTVEGTFRGFACNYLDNAANFQDLILGADDNTKLELLRQAKDIILTLQDNCIIHGDLSQFNFLISKRIVHLIDMHNASVDGLPLDVTSYLTKQYLKHNEVDFGLDIYLFNLLTYAVFKGTSCAYASEAIRKGSISQDIQDVYNSMLAFKSMNRENMLIDRIKDKAKIRLL